VRTQTEGDERLKEVKLMLAAMLYQPIVVQMSAGLFSDKATELSNRFLLLLPWRQDGMKS